ncbi:hypothetical protein L596_007060 [Steinernema carpocapsae]|uniref:Uncharacterized protein n=1 Tax=Steinernema carpocapsae TaxID=34508 RepID=A0A4U5P845_STECR|nr:hypothetical protein L596_007060 [Steinernema carpocapsae]
MSSLDSSVRNTSSTSHPHRTQLCLSSSSKQFSPRSKQTKSLFGLCFPRDRSSAESDLLAGPKAKTRCATMVAATVQMRFALTGRGSDRYPKDAGVTREPLGRSGHAASINYI